MLQIWSTLNEAGDGQHSMIVHKNGQMMWVTVSTWHPHTQQQFLFSWQHKTHTKKSERRGGKTQMTWSLVERKKSSPKHPPPFARHTQLYSQQEFCSNLFSLCVCRQEKLCFVSGLYFQLMKTDECIERVHLVHPRDRLNHPHHQASLFFSLDPTNTVICW
jgi:hypothetical protein